MNHQEGQHQSEENLNVLRNTQVFFSATAIC